MRIDPPYFRPAEVELLLGGSTDAREKLVWVPEIAVREICAKILEGDLKIARQRALLKLSGSEVSLSRKVKR